MNLKNKVLGDRRVMTGIAIAVVLILAIAALVWNQNYKSPGSSLDLVTYENQEYGFSFDHPRLATLDPQAQPPVLARVILPEGYLDASGNPASYLLEVSLGEAGEGRLYAKQINDGTNIFTLSLNGPIDQEIPESVRDTLRAASNSFQVGS